MNIEKIFLDIAVKNPARIEKWFSRRFGARIEVNLLRGFSIPTSNVVDVRDEWISWTNVGQQWREMLNENRDEMEREKI